MPSVNVGIGGVALHDQHSITCSDEAAMLASSASELLEKRADFANVRTWLQSETGFDRALYREQAALGWLGLAVPASYGGSELPFGTLTGVMEAMGRKLVASPLLASTLAAQALVRSGTAAQKQIWLPKLVSGEAIGSLAISEPRGSYELEHISATATRTAAGFTLAGTKTFVFDAQNADFVIVAARLEGKLALLLVTREQLGKERVRREIVIDETRRSARITLDGLQAPSDALLDAADAHATLRHVQRAAWLLIAADMAGGAEGVMQLTLDYLKTRKQFGKLIGSYQSLKHPMVDIMCGIEDGRSLLYHAATVFDGDELSAESALRMAKAQLGETYAYAADRAVQFHGAIGFTYECHAQLFFRRAQWALHAFGDSLHHRRHLARLLLPALK